MQALRRLVRCCNGRAAALLAACLAWSVAAQAAGGRVLLGGPAWAPTEELCALVRPPSKEAPVLLVLRLDEAPACEWPGWSVESRTLAPLPAQGEDPVAERLVAARIGRADAVLLDGGTWIGWWRRMLPAKRAGILVRALQEARTRGVLLAARGEAARFVGGGLLLPDEAGREMKNLDAQERAWIVEGVLLETPLCVEHDGARGRGAGLVFDATARELRVAGGRELERAFVVARDGALCVDEDARTLLAVGRPALRIGLEHMRKLGDGCMDQVALDALPVARLDRKAWSDANSDRWHAWTKPCAAPGVAAARAQTTTSGMELASLLEPLGQGACAEHKDELGTLLRCGGSRSARWTRRAER